MLFDGCDHVTAQVTAQKRLRNTDPSIQVTALMVKQ